MRIRLPLFRGPADLAKASEAPDADFKAFGVQQCTFQRLVAAVPSQRAASSHHAVTWRRGVVAVPHDVADRPPRARPPGQDRPRRRTWRRGREESAAPPQAPVCENQRAPVAIATDSRQSSTGNHHEATLSYRPTTILRRNVTPPRLDSSNSWETLFGSSPSASGTVARCASAAAPSHCASRSSAPPRM